MRQMKDSGIPWIGEIPSEWDIRPIKSCFNIGRGRVIAKNELDNGMYPIYSSQTKDKGIMGYLDTYDFDITQLTWTTDGANAGTVFLREGKHNCTNVCGTLQPKSEDINMQFAEMSVGYVAFFNKRADTNGFKIMNNEMANILFTVPPLDEQIRLANYLDQKISLIDNIIEKTKQSIEEYKKLKQSIITEAVTKGLNPDVKMKDSGIEWIGEIPEHWSLHKGNLVFQIPSCSISDEELSLVDNENYSPVQFLKVDDMNRTTNGIYMLERDELYYTKSKKPLVTAPMLLIPKRGAAIYTNKIRICDFNCFIDPNIMALKTSHNLKYMAYFLMGRTLSNIGDVSTIPQINNKHIFNLKITIPSNFEQNEIVISLEQKLSKLEECLFFKESLINELESYKKSLIYEVVTGKKEIA